MNFTRTNARDILDAISLLRPFDIDVPKIRYGSRGDGGYVFADNLHPSQPVLSFGISDNCELEFDLAERGHRVFMFDPSVAAPPKQHVNFEFRQIGVTDRDRPELKLATLTSCLEMCSLEGRSDIILKIDIEGAEWPTISSLSPEVLLHFEQIVVELHWLERLEQSEYRESYLKSLSIINKHFVVFHAHANNCAPIVIVGGKKFQGGHGAGGFPVPSVIELSYIKRTKAQAKLSRTYYPSTLDYPNHPFYPDHILSFYPFLPSDEQAEEYLKVVSELSDVRLKLSGNQDVY